MTDADAVTGHDSTTARQRMEIRSEERRTIATAQSQICSSDGVDRQIDKEINREIDRGHR